MTVYRTIKLLTIKAAGTTVTICRTYHTFSSDCEASFNQGDYNCIEVSCFSFEQHFNNMLASEQHLTKKAIDEIIDAADNGWAYGGKVPSWAVFKFTEGR